MPCVVKFFTGFNGGSHADGYVEGFDYKTGNCGMVSSPVYSGAYSFRVFPTTTATAYGVVAPPGGDGTLEGNFNAMEVFGCLRFWVGAFPGTGYEHLLTVDNTGYEGMRICVDHDGYLHLRDGSENLLGISPDQITTGQWYLLEFKQKKSDESYELKVDGVSKISGTIGAGWPGVLVRNIFVGKNINISSQTIGFYYDDLVLCTGDYLTQPYSISTGSPVGDGYHTSWAHDWNYVKDVPPDGDITYRHAATEGAKATQVRTAPTGVGAIAAVMASFCVKRTYGGNSVKTLLRSNGTDKESTLAKLLGTNWTINLCQLEETDFGRGGIPWTNANVGTLEFGLEHTAGVSGEGSRWTSATLSVLYCGSVCRAKAYYDLGG
jgi:hypothetical protein